MSLNSADLPSATAAKSLVSGDMSAVLPVVGWTTMRAVLIGSGLLLAGQRKNVVKSALFAAWTVEAWILAWAALEKKS